MDALTYAIQLARLRAMEDLHAGFRQTMGRLFRACPQCESFTIFKWQNGTDAIYECQQGHVSVITRVDG